MLNPDFYPTPPDVAATMLDPIDLRGRTVVEPSAGSGNLVRECLALDAGEVLAVEPEPKLRAILWGCHRSNVCRRMQKLNAIGLVDASSGHGGYHVHGILQPPEVVTAQPLP